MANMRLSQTIGLRQEIRAEIIQSLKLLMEPILNLEQVIRQNLSENPLLEEDIEEEKEEITAPEVPDPRKDAEPTKAEQEMDWERYLGEGNEYTSGSYRDFSEKEEGRSEQTQTSEKTLYDHLFEQLGLAKFTEDEIEIGAYIIGNIDDSGFLTREVDKLALDLKVEREAVEKVLEIIRKFDPIGVGSRDLRECLLIQLEEQGLEETLVWELVDQHLYVLDKKSIPQLAKMTSTTNDRIKSALDIIKTLSPRPAQGRFVVPAAAVTPDLVIEKVGEEFVVYHNDKNLPRLKINSSYRSLIKRGNKTPEDTKKYVREKLEQARWLISAIDQRRRTMIRVMNAIVAEQIGFFERGEDYLKPLTMEQIADIVEMNVATISRVSSGKFVQTPLGVFEIKFFFVSGVHTDDGEDLSKRTVKNRIQEIVKAENSVKPLSDQEIANTLKHEGIKLARRTVTKYREEMGVQAARFRKQT